jgi:hypothetical protein
MDLWFKNNWIPYKKVQCKQNYPYECPPLKHLAEFCSFRVKCKKKKGKLFLIPRFPQIDLILPNGQWQRIGGNTKVLREQVEKFISENLKDFQGFETGIYGDKSPGQQAAEQFKRHAEGK